MDLNDFNRKLKELRVTELQDGDCYKSANFLLSISEDNATLAIQVEHIYAKSLFSLCDYMRSVALRSLLINLEVIKPLYVKTAIGILRNRKESWELRLTAFSSISHVYFQKRDTGIMSILSIILKDKNEHFNIRLSAFDAILRVYGYTTQELLLKNYIILLVQEEKYLNFDEFLKEKMHDFKGDFVNIGKLIESDFTNFMFDT